MVVDDPHFPTAGPVIGGSPSRAGRFRSTSRQSAWLWVLGAGTTAYLLTLLVLTTTEDPYLLPALILLGSATVPATVLVLAACDRQRAPIPPALVLLVVVLGGFLGTLAAGTLEYDTLQLLGVLPMVLVGLIEEGVKLVVPLVVLLRSRRRSALRDPRAGVLIGVASAAGFATLETMGYAFDALLAHGSIHDVEQTLLLRALVAPAGHVAWTGVACAALWAVAAAPPRSRAGARFVVVFVAVVLLHTAWDGAEGVVLHTLMGFCSFAWLGVVLQRADRSTPRAGRDSDQLSVGTAAP